MLTPLHIPRTVSSVKSRPAPKPSLSSWLADPPKKRKSRGRKVNPGAVGIGTILAQLSSEVGPRGPNPAPFPPDEWERLVGVRIANRSAPERLDPNGTLVVRVPSSVWAQELSLLQTDILERLATTGFKVRQLRILVGEVEKLRPLAGRFIHRSVATPIPLPESIKSAIERIDDDALRESLSRAATASLAEAAADVRRQEKRDRDAQRLARPRRP